MPIESWIQAETLCLLREGVDLGPVCEHDGRLAPHPHCDLCGGGPVPRGRLVRLEGVPVVRDSLGRFSLRLAPILSEDDHRAATYLPCAACWPSCMAEGNR